MPYVFVLKQASSKKELITNSFSYFWIKKHAVGTTCTHRILQYQMLIRQVFLYFVLVL